MMTIEQHFKKYVDKYGLVQIEPGKTSQNGLHFTALAVIALSRHKYLDTFSNLFLRAFRNCEPWPGIYRRSPTNFGDQTGIDDYMGIAVVAAFLDSAIAKRVLATWDKNKGFLNNVKKDSYSINAWFGRYPALYATFQYAADERPSLLNELYWLGAVIWAAFQPAKDQDGWRMSFMMVEVAKGQTLLSLIGCKIWRWRAKRVLKHGIGGNLSEYWQGDMNHPLVINLWDQW